MKKKDFIQRSIAACLFIFGFLFMGCASRPASRNPYTRSLSEYIGILEAHRNGVLANRDGERLRTQLMTFSFAEDNRAYFCTTSDNPVYGQLVAYPNVSYCTFPASYEPVLSLSGRVVFVEDRGIKQRALETNNYAMRNFRSIENPLLRVFYIDVEFIEIYSSEGTFIYNAK